MSKKAAVTKLTKSAKKLAKKIEHPPYMRVNIPAGMASPAPPLGPQIGQRGIKIANFCKDFNEMTADIKPGIILPTDVVLNPDRSFTITPNKPTASFFLKQAAGIKKGVSNHNIEIAGKVTLKHVYEIAKIKSQDPAFTNISLKSVCKCIISTAHTLGIEVVKDINPEEYGHFLKEREKYVEEKRKELEEKRSNKLLRL